MRHLFCFVLLALALPVFAVDRPNVILIITDDQGYGDVGAHGNMILKTPNLDALHRESIRLTDYHVDPTCSPTRAALLTGRYSTRTGVWHTINGRSMMDGGEYTLAEYFKDNGYRTAMFGKWHLGDNAPLRPMDQGFDHCVWHKGGGITQGADYFGNDYFDDTYDVNGKWQKFAGYCTDVFFRETVSYLDDVKDKDEPFFVYLATNAPHGPFFVEGKYSQPYKDLGVPEKSANFYGMIANIDENLGKLRAYLQEQGLAENTILIYTTDNGTAKGLFQSKENESVKGFNAGMRARKGSEYEGGHRVPFFIHWPKGGLMEGRDVDHLIAHIDVMPTLTPLVGLKPIRGNRLVRGPLDGRSFYAVFMGIPQEGPLRTEKQRARDIRFVHSQRTSDPIKWRKSAVMTERYRLINGKELYEIAKDPEQKDDVAASHPCVVKALRVEYDQWWASLTPVFKEVVRYDLGGAENPTTLMSHDWLMEGEKHTAWHQNHVKRNDLINGPFMVDIKRAGRYRITPMRWPAYVDKPSGCVGAQVHLLFESRSFTQFKGDQDPKGNTPSFEFDLPVGPAKLTTHLFREDGKTFGAYFVKVEYLGEADEE